MNTIAKVALIAVVVVFTVLLLWGFVAAVRIARRCSTPPKMLRGTPVTPAFSALSTGLIGDPLLQETPLQK